MYYTGCMYYGNNDYRDYVSHSFLGSAWKGVTKYLDKIKQPNGKFRYIYEMPKNAAKAARDASKAAGNFIDKKITGNSYKRTMKQYSNYGDKRYSRASRSKMQAKYTNARSDYNKTLRGRAESVGRRLSSLTKAGMKTAGNLLRRGRSALNSIASRVGNSKFGRAISGLVNKGSKFLRSVLGFDKRAANKKVATSNSRQARAERGADIKGTSNRTDYEKEVNRRRNQYRSRKMQRDLQKRGGGVRILTNGHGGKY